MGRGSAGPEGNDVDNLLRALLRVSEGIDTFNRRLGRWVAWLIFAAVVVSSVNAVVRKAFDEVSSAFRTTALTLETTTAAKMSQATHRPICLLSVSIARLAGRRACKRLSTSCPLGPGIAAAHVLIAPRLLSSETARLPSIEKIVAERL